MELVLDFLLITGILIACSFLFVLFKQTEKEISHHVLITIFIFILFVFVSFYAYLHQIRTLFLFTFLLSDIVDMSIGPLLFIYVKCITGDTKKFFRNNRVHFILPTLYLIGISIPLLIRITSDGYEASYIDRLQKVLLFTIAYSGVYCVFALQKLIRFQVLVKLNYSNLENKDLNWAKYLLMGAIFIISIDLSTSIYELFAGDAGMDIGYFSVIPIVFLMAYLGYYGVSQSKVLLPDFLWNISETKDIFAPNHQKKGPLKYTYDEEQMKILRSDLTTVMNEQKPYLDENLTLSSLSDRFQVSDKKLSTLLNQHMNTSFYDYVNRFRVEEVKKMILDTANEKYTLLAIAYDCGFKSKSSFNRIFKKETGISPKDYRKKVQ
ncbi:MAG: helix-turn-helix domain-containing protein [Saonia sp.]